MSNDFNSLNKQNFKTLEEVQAALAAPFPESVLKKRKDWYFIPVERIRQRLIQVVGVDGFDIEYSQVRHHDEDWITVDCTLTIDFTPWGGRVKRVTQSDGVQIKRHTKGENQGMIVDLGNDYKSVMSGALAKAAQDFGIGLYLQFSNYNQNGVNSNGAQNNRNTNTDQSNGYNGGNNPATENQRNAAARMEKVIGLTGDTKWNLFKHLFPNATPQNMEHPTFSQMDRYLKTIKPVADIIRIAKSANYNQQQLFHVLSQQFKRKITSFTNLLTLADESTVKFVETLVKQSRQSA
jgi:hypothetical protein